MLATVCPVTIIETDCASLPLSANVFAISVAVPKNAPCGRPEMKRAASSMGALMETALSVLPTSAIAMNRMMRFFGGTLRPNTRISVPTHTPIAYAEMKWPAVGMLTCMAAAVWGRMPIITNSAAPRMNAPDAKANMLLFMCSLFSRNPGVWNATQPISQTIDACISLNVGGLGNGMDMKKGGTEVPPFSCRAGGI